MKIAVAQITSTDQPDENLELIKGMMAQAKSADLFLTPEVTNCISLSRKHQNEVLQPWEGNEFLMGVQDQARALQLPTLIGSIAIKTDDPDGRFANRSVLIDGQGSVTAHYDKMHMFDVQLSETESYAESSGFRPGQTAVLAQAAKAMLGLTICYDLRFPHFFRDLAKAGAQVFTVPSAFAVATGQAHWEVLLRARAIETGAFIVAPAQTGTHPGSGRKTYGHSLVVAPWGDVLLDAGTEPGLHFVDLDLSAVDSARIRVASLTHDRPYLLER